MNRFIYFRNINYFIQIRFKSARIIVGPTNFTLKKFTKHIKPFQNSIFYSKRPENLRVPTPVEAGAEKRYLFVIQSMRDKIQYK